MAAMPAAAADPLKFTVLTPDTAHGGPVRSLYGTLSPFYGTLSPFYGTLSPFYGTLSPFYGTLSPFWGNLSAFWGNLSAFQGQVDPFWGNLSAFSTTNGANTAGVPLNYSGLNSYTTTFANSWGTVGTTWAGLGAYSSANKASYKTLASQVSGLLSTASTFWGPTVVAKTGKSFDTAFTQPLLTRFGLSLSDPSSFASLTPVQQSQFILAMYDGLMDYTGTDHVDHWMKEVNWTPSLTQIQGAGTGTVVGLLDFTVRNAADIQDNIVSSTGVSTYSNGHGAGVASLIVAGHDGSGVMGIAPNASVVQYNPFDSTGTTNWTDIQTGLITLGNAGAGVINASLGVPGYSLSPDWNAVLMNSNVRNALKNAILVTAAGNGGVTQTANVEWDKGNAQFLVVGSTDPTGAISSFSNRPGNVCLTTAGKCNGDYLMNHFITAPGEWLLVSDDSGATTRVSGTSFAAPLVSGAIALLEDRWPWLSQHPKDIFTIVTKSAKDLGAPGVDPVYGVGQLDVTASQSPLSYDALQWWSPKAGVTTVRSLGDLQQTTSATLHDPKQQATWEANGVYIYGYEQLSETYRDFAIPLSSKLVGQSAIGATGQQEQLQSYLTNSFKTWAQQPAATTTTTGKFAFLNFRGDAEATVGKVAGLTVNFAAAPQVAEAGWRSSSMPFASRMSVAAPDGSAALRFGVGEGASNLGGVTGLNLHSDYDPLHGGANPLLGFASGGGYGAVDLAIAPGLKLTAGATSRDSKRDLDSTTGADRLTAIAVGDYQAQAQRVGVTWRAGSRVQFTGGYTHLSENNGLLGVQSTDRSDLRNGTQTSGFDVGADLLLAEDLSLSGAATVGRTGAQGSGAQNLTVGGAGLTTSSFQLALTRRNLLGNDRLRLSVAQPIHLESGRLSYSSVAVVNRDTGELGVTTQSFDATQNVRPLVAEMLYGRTIFAGAGELGLFGRAETRAVGLDGRSTPALTTGARFRFAY